jgi:hypothetical protein
LSRRKMPSIPKVSQGNIQAASENDGNCQTDFFMDTIPA